MFEGYVPAVLLGTAIGDAMGMPFESYGCQTHEKLDDWKGDFVEGNFHKLEAGRWTDDTEMTLELAKSMLHHKRYLGASAASHYYGWFKGNPTGMGSTTRDALRKFDIYADDKGELWRSTGVDFTDPEKVGSGTAMRAAPIGVMYHDMPEMLRRVARADAYITHAHPEAYAASLAIAATVAGTIRQQLFAGPGDHPWKPVHDFVKRQLLVVDGTLTAKAFRYIEQMLPHGASEQEFADDIAGRFGSAWQCATTAIYCAFRGWRAGFHLGVQLAVKLGGDADTRGAMTGAILGARYGVNKIPLPLRNRVYQGNEIAYMDGQLFNARVSRYGQDMSTDLG